MHGSDSDYWDDKPNISEEVFKYSKEFVSRFENSKRKFDYSEESIIREISFEIDQYGKWDLTNNEDRIYWAQLLSYFSVTLCEIFGGKCVGDFPKHNPAGAYYTFRVKIKNKYYNVEEAVGRACDKQFEIIQWYKNLKETLLGCYHKSCDS